MPDATAAARSSAGLPTAPSSLWTIRDAANFLAVSARTVERARNRGNFPPAVRIGKAVRFESAAVIEWALAGQEAA
jgi:excisionase family DNA binding protein